MYTNINVHHKEGVFIMNEYLSFSDAVKYMGFKSYTPLYHCINSGLPTVQIGNTKRISKSAIDKFMQDHTVVATQDK